MSQLHQIRHTDGSVYKVSDYTEQVMRVDLYAVPQDAGSGVVLDSMEYTLASTEERMIVAVSLGSHDIPHNQLADMWLEIEASTKIVCSLPLTVLLKEDEPYKLALPVHIGGTERYRFYVRHADPVTLEELQIKNLTVVCMTLHKRPVS